LSSFNLFLIFILLSHAQKKQHKSGEILFLYLILASLERFIVEFFRGDSEPVIWGLTIFQVISLVTLFISINGEVSIRGRKRV
jgi:phosphatidylglycerol:prolipoprotein diacylglycerol transferase